MKVTMTPEATAFILRRGGQLYVWADRKRCCRATAFVQASTEAPKVPGEFRTIEIQGFQLLLRPAGGTLPDELEVELRGRRHPKVRAYWNGCAFVV
jgi:hypothetical protein